MLIKTQLGIENWKNKYSFNGEEPINTWQRLAKTLASLEKNPEEWYDIFLRTMVKFDLETDEPIGLKNTTGGRITANAGTTYKGATVINCYVNGAVTGATISYKRKSKSGLEYPVVIKTPETPDNLSNIFLTILEQAKTLAAEGGYGINMSFIRPRGSIIKGVGIKHPGVVAYMKIWNTVSECIVQGDDDGYKDKIRNFLKPEEVEELVTIIKKQPRKGAMMGVLNCVSGSTVISTLDGRIPIKDLVGKNPYVYCTDGNKGIYIRRADKVWKSGRKKTIKISFDDDSSLVCTPDHLIMLSSGKYKKASELKFGDSIAAFHKNVYVRKGVNKNSGYYYIGITGKRSSIPEHHAICEMKYGFYPQTKKLSDGKTFDSDNSQVAHHEDLDSLNNHPDNIKLITFKEHCEIHKDLVKSILDANRGRIAQERKGKTWEEYYGKERAEKLKMRMRDRIKLKNRKAWNKGLSGNEYKEHYKDGFSNQFNESVSTWEDAYGIDGAINAKKKKKETIQKKLSNHKVICVEEWIEEDVYDISVPYFHNFVANGVFVHNCDHPDLEEFIRAKQESGVLTKFNLSIAVDNKFMEAVVNDDLYEQKFNGKVYKKVKARDLYNLIMESTYNRGEPGILFVDNMHDNNPISYIGKALATNPCGEIPGLSSVTTVCLLGSPNLTQYVRADRTFDFDAYTKDLKIFVRMLDNVNDLAKNPLPSYDWAVKNFRQIGIGLNGLGSALLMLGIPYNSKEGVEFTKKLCQIKENATWQASALLAKEKGAFPAYDAEKFQNTKYFKSNRITKETKELIKKYGVRNAKTTTNPPAGNTSVICDSVSSGIEPIIDLEYERVRIIPGWPEGLNKDNIKEFLKEHKRKGYSYWRGEYNGVVYHYEPHNRGLCDVTIVRDYGYQWMLDNFPDEDCSSYVTMSDLEVGDHLAIQEVVQYYCNQSVSKCLVEGQSVNTNKGLVLIEDFCNNKEEINKDGFYKPRKDLKVYNECGKLINIKNFYYGGIKPSYQIKFSNGTQIGVSENHKIMTIDGLKSAKDIKNEDLVFIQNYDSYDNNGGLPIDVDDKIFRNCIKRRYPRKMSKLFAELLGMLISDGTIGEMYFALIEKNSVVSSRYDKLCKDVFGIKPTIIIDKRNNVRQHSITSKPLSIILKQLIGRGAYNKRIPQQIIDGSNSEMLACLRGISLDGYYISDRKKQCLYAGMSKVLAEQIFNISVKLFGIESCYFGTKVVKLNSNICYMVFIGRKIDMIEDHKNKNVLEWNRYVFVDKDYVKGMKVNYKDELYNSFNNMKRRILCEGQNKIRKSVAIKLGIPYRDIIYVTDINYIGLRNVYDIEVDSDSHLYLVNNLITHNTISLPNKYSFTKFKDLYIDAWKKKLNGITTYREGSMESVLSSIEKAEKTNQIIKKDIKLPESFLNGPTTIIKREGYKFYINFSYLPDDVDMKFPVCIWIYTNAKLKGQAVACNRAARKLEELASSCGIHNRIVSLAMEKATNDDSYNKLGRMISLCLRHNISLEKIYVTLSGLNGDNISTLLTAVRKFISNEIDDGTKLSGLKCECGSENFVMVSGCKQCKDCGFSACG